jgi:hypothetical protein
VDKDGAVQLRLRNAIRVTFTNENTVQELAAFHSKPPSILIKLI